MKTPRLPILLLVLLVAASTSFGASLRLEPGARTTEWTVYHGDQRLLVCAFDPTKFKPYVKELYTTKGYNVLRDAPSDHLHHHALMYGIRVNGLNFWEETAGCGVMKPVETSKPELGTTANGLPQARMTQLLHWVAPEDAFLPDTAKAALLIEQRVIAVTVDAARNEVALEWNSQFQAGTRTNKAVLTGANYHGIGMRFPQEFDPVAKHVNSANVPDLSGGKQDVSPGEWGSVFFDLPNRPTTVVLFGHPGNARGNARFFTMKTPFAYLSATQGLDQEPLTYRSGEKFQLRYLVTVYPEAKSAEAIAQRGKEWR